MSKYKLVEGSLGNLPAKNQVGSYPRNSTVDDMRYPISTTRSFFALLNDAILKTEVTNNRDVVKLEIGLSKVRSLAKLSHSNGNRVIFIGNGGSSAIASHMAVDFTKNGGIRAIAFNDAPTLTCLANDFGYEHVFSKQLEYYATDGDLVIIVSSSGKSGNIMQAAEQAFSQGLDLITFSGMRVNNVLRRKGILNFYVPANDYGLVELAHLTLLHSIVSVSD